MREAEMQGEVCSKSPSKSRLRSVFDRQEWFAREILSQQNKVHSYLRKYLRSSNDIADCLQETYARLLARSDSDLQRIRRPLAFLLVASRHSALQWIRRSRVVTLHQVATLAYEEDGADPAPSAFEQVAWFQQLACLNRALELLPKRALQVLILRRLYGFSQKEVAQKLGISVNTVDKHAANGIRHCLACLKDWSTRPMPGVDQALRPDQAALHACPAHQLHPRPEERT